MGGNEGTRSVLEGAVIAAEPSPFVWVPEYGLVAIAGGFVVATVLFSLFARYRFRSLYDREERGDAEVAPRQVFAAQILYNRSRIAIVVVTLLAIVVGMLVLLAVSNGSRSRQPYRSTDTE
jgi:hypothetical protein